jgi:hypothetical protein
MRRPLFNRLYHGRYLLGLCVIFALFLASAPFVDADTSPGLVVTDEGPGVVNTVGVTASAGGTCADVYEAQQANGTAMCPVSSWPEPGGQWQPTLAIDEGDTLRFTFTSPVSDVTYASTTDSPIGLTTPEGAPAPNRTIIPPSNATSSANADVWTAPIPNPLSPLAASAVTFAVVARDATEYHDYSLSIEKPYCVEPGVPLMPGTFTCPIHPAQPSPGSGGSSSGRPPQYPQPTITKDTSNPHPVIHIMSVQHQVGHRYRVTVFVSSPGSLVLTWFQRSRRIARFSRWLAGKRTVFDVQVMTRRGHSRLKVDATFHAQDGAAAQPVTAFTDL